MDDTPPEQRTALLLVVEMNNLCIDQFNEYTINEFRLQGGTGSLKDCVDLCFLEENGEYDKHRIVWITENVFVRLGMAFIFLMAAIVNHT
jgi:hypothetical protein